MVINLDRSQTSMVTQNEGPQYDCVFVKTNSEMEGMGGLDIAHIYQFFSFNYMGRFTLVHLFTGSHMLWMNQMKRQGCGW